jgi:transcription elongation factor Elf1
MSEADNPRTPVLKFACWCCGREIVEAVHRKKQKEPEFRQCPGCMSQYTIECEVKMVEPAQVTYTSGPGSARYVDLQKEPFK